jgi:hypothetical protein
MAMFEFKLEGIEEAKKLVSSKLHKGALSLAVFRTAHNAKQAVIEEMKEVFDRPTPFILGGVRVSHKNYDPTGLSALIDLQGTSGKREFTSAEDILRPHIEGGSRRKKSSEQYLRSYWVPGQGVQLNKYGNIPGSLITQILSYFRKFPEVGYKANITPVSERRKKKKGKLRNFFIVGPGNKGLHTGVWERLKSGRVKPILIFIQNPKYHKRFNFHRVVARAIERNMQRRYDEALREKTGGLINR